MTAAGPGDGRGPAEPPVAVPAAVGLGSNLGDRVEHLVGAVRALEDVLSSLRSSRVWETAPVGAGDQPPFLNMCCVGGSRTGPRSLLRGLQEIEREEGRTRPEGRGPAPRTLDLDLLLYGERRIEERGLTVPHPRMRERAFVLVPLAEIAGSWRDPESGTTVEELARRVDDSGVALYPGPLPAELRRTIDAGTAPR